MSQTLPLNEDQRDCLQELTNIAMGAAGESLADFTNTFVTISIPKIRCVSSECFIESLSQLKNHKQVSAVSQAFILGDDDCMAMVAISDESFTDLSEFTGRDLNDDKTAEALLVDLCNTITHICLTRLADMMEKSVDISAPNVVALHQPLTSLEYGLPSEMKTVAVEINYHIEEHPFNCDLLLLFPEPSIPMVTATLDELLS